MHAHERQSPRPARRDDADFRSRRFFTGIIFTRGPHSHRIAHNRRFGNWRPRGPIRVPYAAAAPLQEKLLTRGQRTHERHTRSQSAQEKLLTHKDSGPPTNDTHSQSATSGPVGLPPTQEYRVTFLTRGHFRNKFAREFLPRRAWPLPIEVLQCLFFSLLCSAGVSCVVRLPGPFASEDCPSSKKKGM